ncbi:UDP-3-O-(3-hydroxymyristoyl)glucosamineN-acyltransferase [Striga asiatica]|uniref:UDP-3-O-(3-hydroxymyristoyl)glucosamineN-acyltransferase n=1 Tax=Striga asiatica TaxID=4170 RepID=A0A5A7QWG9_STRAF|nr:UDP-3-O-(3-hydroxymyristoyl)glucosamineN-acyltransferase [Striga asiatica]
MMSPRLMLVKDGVSTKQTQAEIDKEGEASWPIENERKWVSPEVIARKAKEEWLEFAEVSDVGEETLRSCNRLIHSSSEEAEAKVGQVLTVGAHLDKEGLGLAKEVCKGLQCVTDIG